MGGAYQGGDFKIIIVTFLLLGVLYRIKQSKNEMLLNQVDIKKYICLNLN